MAFCDDPQLIIKDLSAKLSAALANVTAKEELVNQHIKVAEDAVSGWETAETELISVKKQLETTAQKTINLEERVSQLDGALKECMRQLRQATEEQEKNVQDMLFDKIGNWEKEKSALESELVEFQSKLEATKREGEDINYDLQLKLEEVERDRYSLKLKLLHQSEQLKICRRDMELSNRAAETASKQYLESIKKMTKVELECRRLEAVIRRSSFCNDHRHQTSSVYAESLTDSQSNSAESIVTLGNESSDPVKSSGFTEAFLDIGTMDDFLEMEKFAATHEVNQRLVKDSYCRSNAEDNQTNSEYENALQRIEELEAKMARLESEKEELENILSETRSRLEMSSKLLEDREVKLQEMQRQLDSSHALNHASKTAAETAEAVRIELQTQLKVADLEVNQLREDIDLLEGTIEKEKKKVEELTLKCETLEDEVQRKREGLVQQATQKIEILKIEHEKGLAASAEKFAECRKTIASLLLQSRSLASPSYLDHDNQKVQIEVPAVGDESEMFCDGYSRSFDNYGVPPPTFLPPSDFGNNPVKVDS